MQIINNLSQIIDQYEIILIDQWGVLHDGKRKFHYVTKTLNALKKNKKKLIIISNSSQRKSSTIKNTLNKINIDKKIFSEIVTSGEVVWDYLKNDKKKKYKNCYFITHLDNNDFLPKLKINTVKDINKANFILNASIKPGLSLKNFYKILIKAKKLELVMICANPDEKVFNGDLNKLVYQAGILANYYEKIGGKVIYFGKPYKEIYKKCLKNYNHIKKNKILCIGDSLVHDIKGANLSNIDSIFVMQGIHNNEIFNSNKNYSLEKKLDKVFKKYNVYPKYIIEKFIY